MAGAASFRAFISKGDGRKFEERAFGDDFQGGSAARAVSVVNVAKNNNASSSFVDLSYSSERSSYSDIAFAPEELSMLENFLCGSGASRDGMAGRLEGAGNPSNPTSLAAYAARQGHLSARAHVVQPLPSFNSPASPLQLQDVLGLPSLEMRPADILRPAAPYFGRASKAPVCLISQNVQPMEQQLSYQSRPSKTVWPKAHAQVQQPSQPSRAGSLTGPTAPVSVPMPWPWGQDLPSQLPHTQPPPQHLQQHLQQQPMQFLSFSADTQLPQGLASWQPNDGDLYLDERLFAEIEAAPWPDFLVSPFARSSADHQAHVLQQQQQQHQQQLLRTQSTLPGASTTSCDLMATGSSLGPAAPQCTAAGFDTLSDAAAALQPPDASSALVRCGPGAFGTSIAGSQPDIVMTTELMLCRQFEVAMMDRGRTPEPRSRPLPLPPAASSTVAAPPMQPAAPSSKSMADVAQVTAAAAAAGPAAAALGFGKGGGGEPRLLTDQSRHRSSSGMSGVPIRVSDVGAAAATGSFAPGRVSKSQVAQAVPCCYPDLAPLPTALAGSAGGPNSAVLSLSAAACTDDTDDGCETETAASGGGGAAAAADDSPAGAKVSRGALTLDTLRAMFALPSQDVVRALGISATDLKRRCRALGIRRWPHRKLASLQRLAQAVDADAELPPQERESVLETVAANRSQIFSDPNTELSPNLKVLRQVQYKRHFLEKRGYGSGY